MGIPCNRTAPIYFFELYDGNTISARPFHSTYTCCMHTISRTLALLKPVDLFPARKWIDIMEERGEIEVDEARRWKEGIYGLMLLWGLGPDEVLEPSP